MFNFLQEVCKRLEELEIEYMISGSVAMSAYNIPRMTRDINIVINVFPKDIKKIEKIFDPSEYYFSIETIESEVRRKGMFNVIEIQTGYKIDFIVRKPTEYHITEFKRRIRREVMGFEAWVVSLEDLLLNKLLWIQEFELDIQKFDIKNIIAINSIDYEYVNKWVKELELKTYDLL